MKGGENVRKIVKVLSTSLILTVLLIVSLTGIAFAGDGHGPNPEPGTCPNPVGPNPDCPYDCLSDSDGSPQQSQVCTTTCNQEHSLYQFGGEGECKSEIKCETKQWMWGIESD